MDATDAPPGFVVLANGAAGSVDERSLGVAVSELAEHAPTTLRRTDSADDVDDALMTLDGRRAVVLGGDGSLHLVVNRLLALGLGAVPIGLVPLGTGNDLARSAGLSLDPASAARTAATGTVRALAVAEHPDEVVVNNAHLGLGAQAALKASGFKRYLGPAAYPMGALVAGVGPTPVDLTIEIDDAPVFDGTAIALLIALGPSAGGGHEIAPDTEPTDPAMAIVAVRQSTVSNRLALVADVLRRHDPSRRDGVEQWTGQHVRVRSAGEVGIATRWDVDGEPRQWEHEVELQISEARWHLVAPG
ncbi:MAG: diacylglycerol/lipid kinase family protein [Acidimicrobiales bacterium]